MKECNSCHRQNNDTATYCKWCGTLMTQAQQPAGGNPSAMAACQHTGLDNLVGKDEIRNRLSDIVGKARKWHENFKSRGTKGRMELSFVITGDAGTGKTTVAEAITEELFNAGLVPSKKPYMVYPLEYDAFVKDIDKNIKSVGNGVLLIEEGEKLVPEGVATEVTQLDHILNPLLHWRQDADKPIVIITGTKRLENFFHHNPNAAATINFFLHTDEITPDGLTEITRRILSEDYRLSLSDDALQKLRRIYLNDQRNPKDAKGVNGHNASKRAYNIQMKCVENDLANTTVGPDMVDGKEFIPKTFDDVMKEFDKFVGVDEIKNCLRSIANSLEEARLAKGSDAKVTLSDHFMFLGNPGTGKTTMARLFADALKALGALPTGQLVEVSRADLISQYVGETPKLVTQCFDKAMGGVLFIDEAYSLKTNENDSVGQEAIDTIIQLAENRRGQLVVILAGYSKEMGEFQQANSGIASRFNRTVNFRDYTGPELTEIFRKMVSHSDEHYTLSAEAERLVGTFFDKMYLARTRTFGNAREVRNAFQAAVQRLKDRIAKARETNTLDPAQQKVITMSDIEGESGKAADINTILSSLDDMVGMQGVKNQLRLIANRVRQDKLRSQRGGKATQPKIHFVITGNPGTGKTVVAKKLGGILKAIGVLTKGHVVERERRTLLDSYANSAAKNMDKAVDEAMGGVLFIDEAYNLIPMGTPGEKDKSGTEAIEALMTRMENDAGKFVCVIAGYKAEIEEFIANANPGLKRRFTYRIHIDDYSVQDLVEIFKLHAGKEGFTLSKDAENLLYKKVEEMVTMKDKNFGNAGEMVNLFNATKDRQSERLSMCTEELTDDQLFTFEPADIPYEPPKKVDIRECLKELDELVGLASVKEAVRELADTLVIEQERARQQGIRPTINLDHYLFLGTPGTGKTTVARIMGNIFYSLGLLPSNKVVEVTSKDLIAPYVGQTAPKTEQMINRALGGIFFIDEAYSLNDGASGFGKDAMPVLLTKLIDYKGKMVSIAAGYPNEMQQWIDTNSGLESRYTRKIFFEDYTGEELAQIFRNIVKQNGLRMDEGADDEMKHYFQVLAYPANKGANFANAREARNYFDRVKLNQGRRLRTMMDLPGFDKEELYILRREDMVFNP